MSMTMKLPVYLRVGEGEETAIGTIEADSVEELQAALAAFLHAASAAVEAAVVDGKPEEVTLVVQADGLSGRLLRLLRRAR